MNKGGRKTDPIWENFEKVQDGDSFYAVCKGCGHKQSNKVYRMKKHYSTCEQSQKSLENQEKQVPDTEMPGVAMSTSRPAASTGDEASTSAADPPNPKKPKLQTKSCVHIVSL